MKLICKLGDLGEYIVEVLPNDSLSSLIQKLNIPVSKSKFTYQGRTYMVNSNLTFSEIGMDKDSIIFFVDQAVSGGGLDQSNMFANFSGEFIKRLDVSKNNPNITDWRAVGKGINLHGICLNKSCIAKGKQVINHINSNEYDIHSEGFMGKCPMCNKYIDLDTCSFYYCDYQVEGTYFDKYIEDWVDLPDVIKSTNGGKVFYYDYEKKIRGKESKVKYKRLILKVTRYHDIE